MQNLHDQIAAAAAVTAVKGELEVEAEKAKITGSTSAPILFNSMRVSMDAMSRNLERLALGQQALVAEARMSRESIERLSNHMEASTNQMAELLRMLHYSMGSSGSTDGGSPGGPSGHLGSSSATKDRFIMGTRIVTKYDVVACVLFRLVMLAWQQDKASPEPQVHASINMSLTYPTLKRVIKAVASSDFKDPITGRTDPPVSILDKNKRATTRVLTRLADSTEDTNAQVGVADIKDICNDPLCAELIEACMKVALRIYIVRGILCPGVKAYCGALGEHPKFREDGGLTLDLDPKPLTLARPDGQFERKVRDMKATQMDAYIKEFLEVGPSEAMRKVRTGEYA